MPESITNTPETTTVPNLSINDLMTVLQLIQLSSTRGTWRAEELKTVGELYEKLLAFLEASGAIQKATAPTAPPADPSADTATAPTEVAPTADQETTNA